MACFALLSVGVVIIWTPFPREDIYTFVGFSLASEMGSRAHVGLLPVRGSPAAVRERTLWAGLHFLSGNDVWGNIC